MYCLPYKGNYSNEKAEQERKNVYHSKNSDGDGHFFTQKKQPPQRSLSFPPKKSRISPHCTLIDDMSDNPSFASRGGLFYFFFFFGGKKKKKRNLHTTSARQLFSETQWVRGDFTHTQQKRFVRRTAPPPLLLFVGQAGPVGPAGDNSAACLTELLVCKAPFKVSKVWCARSGRAAFPTTLTTHHHTTTLSIDVAWRASMHEPAYNMVSVYRMSGNGRPNPTLGRGAEGSSHVLLGPRQANLHVAQRGKLEMPKKGDFVPSGKELIKIASSPTSSPKKKKKYVLHFVFCCCS